MIKSEIKIILTGKLEVGTYDDEQKYNGDVVLVDGISFSEGLDVLDGEYVEITIKKMEA